ncbi:MAG: aminoacyl-tRNA hydrolase [Sphaerochaetaceae bacterium]
MGLGNPGPRYTHTRHNVGFDVVHEVAAFFHLEMKKRCLRPYAYAKIQDYSHLVVPLTYMNNSGKVLSYVKSWYTTVEDIVVVCDTLDLPPGMIRIKKGGSSAGHNGLKSMIAYAQSPQFIRIYVGIGRPVPPATVVEHVLSSADDEKERELVQQGIVKAKNAVLDLLSGKKIEEVIHAYNRRNSS